MMDENRLREIWEEYVEARRSLDPENATEGWAIRSAGELFDGLREALRRQCPGLEEHDALQHMTTRALRAEAEVERLHGEDAIRTKEYNILVRENRLLRAAAEMILADTHKVTQGEWAVGDITVTALRAALDTSAAVRPSDG